MIVSVLCDVLAAPALFVPAPAPPPSPPTMSPAMTPLLREYATLVEILSQIQISRRSASVETMLGAPRIAATSDDGMPTVIWRCTVPTVTRSIESSWTSARCCVAVQAPIGLAGENWRYLVVTDTEIKAKLALLYKETLLDLVSQRGVELNVSDNVGNVPVIYGTRKVGGYRAFIQSGDQSGHTDLRYL